MITEIVLIAVLFCITVYGISLQKRTNKAVLLDRLDVDALKGMSAFFVISAHVYLLGAYPIINGWNGVFFKVIGTILSQLGGIGVMLFFFLSGYGIEEGYSVKELGKQYVINRLKKVYCPYLYIKFAILLGELVLGVANTSDFPKNVIDIFCVKEWFMQVIIIEYFFYFVVGRLKFKKKLLLLFILNAIMGGIYIYMRLPGRYYNSMWLFVVGVSFSIYQNTILKVIQEKKVLLIAGSVVVFGGFGAVFAINKGAMWCEICKPISGVALVLLLICILQCVYLGSPILKWGGKKSLYLYIVHVSLMGYFANMEKIEVALCFIVLSIVIVLVLDVLKTKLINITLMWTTYSHLM